MFLDLAQKNKILKNNDAKKPHKEVVAILQKVASNDETPVVAVDTINAQIKATNETMHQLMYPSIMLRTPLDFLRNEVVAFEMFLNMAMNAKLISFQNETELFNKAIAIWEDIGHIKQSLSLTAFSNLVKQANALLPPVQHYPVPNPDDFPYVAPEDDKEAVAPYVERIKAAPPGTLKE